MNDTITTVDLIVHPWYGCPDNRPYGFDQPEYQDLVKLLKQHEISKEQYANLLLAKYKERIDDITEERNHGLVVFPFYLRLNNSMINQRCDEICDYAVARLGKSHFKRTTSFEFQLPSSVSRIYSYGEMFSICVKGAHKKYAEQTGVTEGGILFQLCGDLPDGKLEAWERFQV